MQSAPEKKQLSLAEFYQSRFNSDPYNLMEDAESDIAKIAEQFDVDWHSTYQKVSLSYNKGKSAKLNGKDLAFFPKASLKGKVAAWAERHEVSLGAEKISVPFISFVAKGGTNSDAWNGFTYLREVYSREVDQIITEQERRARDERNAKKAAERLARIEKLEAESKRKAENAAKSVAKDLAIFDSLPPAIETLGTTVSKLANHEGDNLGDHGLQNKTLGTTVPKHHLYAVKKQILGALGAGDIRIGSDKHGRFLAIKAADILGNARAIQRIYEHKFKLSQDDKVETDKTFTWGADMDAAFFVLGDLAESVKEGGMLRFCEGFATGCTTHLATGDCVIVCFNASNLKKVIAVFCRYYPNSPKIIDADNDCWTQAAGKGNAGLLAAIEMSSEFGIRICYPRFDGLDSATKPSDWNDVSVIHPLGIKGVRKMMRAGSSKLEAAGKSFDYKLQRLSFVPKERALDEALQAINAGMLLVPFKYATRDIYQMVCDSLSVSLDKEKLESIKRRAKWLLAQKMKRAQGFRNFSAETLAKPNVKYERVEPILNLYGHPVLPPKVLRKVLSLDGPIIIRAPMASGKTKHLLAPLMQQAEQGAYLAHRVSLIADACNRLALKDGNGKTILRVDNYQDVIAPMAALVDRMGCCINSITHPKFSQFFAGITELLIDEASQTLRHVADGTVDNPVLVLERLAELMRSADRTVMCDADANDALVEFAEKSCPGQTIHIIEMATDCSNIEVLHTNDLMAHQCVIEAVRRNETVLVADDSAKDGAALAQRLKTECPGTRVLHVHKDSKGETEVEAFLADPNGQASLWDVVIYSPAISSGVSIETPHFKNHVGIFFGAVAPSDAVQMLRRDRTSRRYIVGFHITDHKRETDKDRIFRGRVAADKRALMQADGRTPDWEENDQEIVARWRKTLFDDVWLSATASEREARADFANNMLLILHGDGYRVSRLDSNPLAEEQAAQGKKAAKAAVNEARHQQILNEETPTSEAAQRLMRRDVMSSSERAQLVRFHIENQLCVEQVTSEHIEFWEDAGPKRLAKFEALQANMETCQAFDNHLVDRGVTTTRRLLKTAQHRILRQVFDGLGIDIKTAAGSFTTQQARDTMGEILNSEAAIEEYNELGVGPYVNPKSKPKCATRWIKAIFERMGLATKTEQRGRAKVRHQVITQESWALIADYATRRALQGVSSLTIHDDTTKTESETETAAGDGLTATPPVHVGGALSQVVYKELDTNVLHLAERYPVVYPLVSRICLESPVLFLDEVLTGMAEEVWEDIQRGAISEGSLRYWLERLALSIQEKETGFSDFSPESLAIKPMQGRA